MNNIHGGDIYRNQVNIDFSININPLGVPDAIVSALHEAVNHCNQYPDLSARQLKQAVSKMLDVPQKYLLFGNGASELFMAIVHGILPQKTVIAVPSFYGYEYAAKATGSEIIYYKTTKEHDFSLKEDFLSVLTKDVDLLFLANPNNPTGNLMSREYLRSILHHCQNQGIHVVLDECFIEFCEEGSSIIEEIGQYENLILVRAFTKIFAIPGVRLGYLVCSNSTLYQKISRQLPEWNLSCFAQAAGCACASQTAFMKKTADYVRKEHSFLETGLKQFGIRTYPGKANFLLLYSDSPLYELLLEQGILIRDCSNFRGLGKGFYRVAVKTRKENEILLNTIGELFWKLENK